MVDIKRITVVMPPELLPSLEKQLRKSGVNGVTVEHVQGYGEHPNFFRRDLMHENVRLILYADADKVEEYVDAIQSCASKGNTYHGVLTVETIDRMERLAAVNSTLAAED